MRINHLRKWLAGGVILLALTAVNAGIWQKERVLKEGAVMILQLAPADPRSLMQGDYMALNYAITQPLQLALYQQREVCRSVPSTPCIPLSGKVIVQVNADRQAIAARFAGDEVLKPDELRVKYRMSAGAIKVGTDAYFFQEGHAERFERAHYGAFRVSSDGTALLTAMLDEQGKVIQP